MMARWTRGLAWPMEDTAAPPEASKMEDPVEVCR